VRIAVNRYAALLRKGRGAHAPRLFFALGVVLSGWPFDAGAGFPADKVTALVEVARDRELAQTRQWRRLGHWREVARRGPKSVIDGERFFLAPNGKTDPAAELTATIQGIYGSATRGDAHPACRFPARTMWLQRQLAQAGARLPKIRCSGFDAFFAKLAPKAVHLVFSSYYLNNPSTAFGHTLFRIERGADAELLDYGVNYAAHTSGENFLLYAVKGMSGAYPGYFRLLPFYYKVREYADFESRDLWSYELDLAPVEVHMLVAHLWELDGVRIDYFYLSENCSYQLLSIIEVARPDVDLVARLTIPVAPAATVRAIYDTPGLVREIRHRPSLHTRFSARMTQITGGDVTFVRALVQDPQVVLPERFGRPRQARLLDAAIDLVDLRYAKDLVYEPDGEGAQTRQALLVRRAELGFATPPLSVPAPDDKMPHQSHGNYRFGAGFGWVEGDGIVGELHGRVGVHDLLDPPDGYPELMEIDFFSTRLHVPNDAPHLRVEHLDAVAIKSLVPISRVRKLPSWQLSVGGTRLRHENCGSCFVGRLSGGTGLTLASSRRRAAIWGLASGLVIFGEDIEKFSRGVRARGGLGAAVGARVRPIDALALVFDGRWHGFPGQAPGRLWHAQAAMRWWFHDSASLGVRVTRQSDAWVGSAGLFGYF